LQTYQALTRLAIQRQFTYRAAALAGLATNLFFGLLRAAVMVALYGARQQVEGMTVQDAITYTGLTQALIAYLALFSWMDIIRSVHSGEIGGDLLKPVNYFAFWMAKDLGRALVNLLTRGLTIMVFYAVVFDISYPRLPAQWLGLALAILLAWLVSFSFRFLVNLFAFWTPNAIGFARFFYALSWFASGFMMPLRYFPDWFVHLCNLTPFPSMVSTVTEVYLGLLSGPQVFRALFFQAVWALILIGAGQLVFRAGVRRLVIQGG
jgi:ABC-2 type transport system permease protein